MKRLTICLLAVSSLAGCASTYRGEMGEPAIERHQPKTASGGPSQGLIEAPLERADLRIERSGWIRVDSKNEMQASNRLRRTAAQFDATVMSFNDHGVSFKMPSVKVETLLEVLEKTEGWEIDEFDFSAWDRTGEYYSVEARIESTNAVKARLLKILEAAATVDEVLKIHGKLESIEKELDGYNGLLRDIKLRAGRVEVSILFD